MKSLINTNPNEEERRKKTDTKDKYWFNLFLGHKFCSCWIKIMYVWSSVNWIETSPCLPIFTSTVSSFFDSFTPRHSLSFFFISLSFPFYLRHSLFFMFIFCYFQSRGRTLPSPQPKCVCTAITQRNTHSSCCVV